MLSANECTTPHPKTKGVSRNARIGNFGSRGNGTKKSTKPGKGENSVLKHDTIPRFQKIHDREEARRVRCWKPVAVRSADQERLQEIAEFLKPFEGCYVKADAILSRLALVVPPPRYSLVVWGENWMWFPLGTCVALSLPLEDPGHE